MIIGITTTYEEDHGYERANVEYLERIAQGRGHPRVGCLPRPGGEARHRRSPRGGDAHRWIGAPPEEATSTRALRGSTPARNRQRRAYARYLRDGAGAIRARARPARPWHLPRYAGDERRFGGYPLSGYERLRPHCGRPPAATPVRCDRATRRRRLRQPSGAAFMRTSRNGAWLPAARLGWPADLETGRAGTGPCTIRINTMHHQALASLAPVLRVSAVSDDGIVEAVEDPTRSFFLGVQWHPEYLRKGRASVRSARGRRALLKARPPVEHSRRIEHCATC